MTGVAQVVAASAVAIAQDEITFTTPGTYSWTAPSGVTSVCVVSGGR